MQHSIPQAGDADALRSLTDKFGTFISRQPGEVQASLLAFLHLVEADASVSSEFLITRGGNLELRIKATRPTVSK